MGRGQRYQEAMHFPLQPSACARKPRAKPKAPAVPLDPTNVFASLIASRRAAARDAVTGMHKSLTWTRSRPDAQRRRARPSQPAAAELPPREPCSIGGSSVGIDRRAVKVDGSPAIDVADVSLTPSGFGEADDEPSIIRTDEPLISVGRPVWTEPPAWYQSRRSVHMREDVAVDAPGDMSLHRYIYMALHMPADHRHAFTHLHRHVGT